MNRFGQKHGIGQNTNFVMFLRAMAVNSLCGSLLFWLYQQGWIDDVLKYDTIFISRTIAGLGFLGLAAIAVRIFQVSKELNIAKEYQQRLLGTDANRADADAWFLSTNSRVAEFVSIYRKVRSDDKPVWVDEFRKTIASKLYIFGSTTEWLTVLGLLGTVVGFQAATNVIAGLNDINLLVPFVQKVASNLRIAIDTTIVGICFALWLDINLRWILRPGAVQLIHEAVKIGILYHE